MSRIGYTQSDEINLVGLSDTRERTLVPWQDPQADEHSCLHGSGQLPA